MDLSECSQRLYEPISKEEVSWALNVVKKDTAHGLYGVVMEMMPTERLLEVCVALFRVCWEREMVPTTVLFVENCPVGSRSVGRSVSQSAASLCNAIIEASSLRNRYYAVKI